MMRNLRLTFVLIVLSLCISGCASDVKDIEKLNYASAIGVDYKDGKYHGYIQFVDFQSIAKSTEGKKQTAKIWVGEGVGSSFEESFFALYQTAQERIYWGHLTSVIVSEAAFKRGFGEIYDSIVRYYEFRLTPWVFGTRESVKDILSTGGFLGQSPLSTILHEPEGIYAQSSTIKPIKLHRLIGEIYEPGYTSCIPVLAVNNKQWKEKNQNEPKLMIDGAIFLKNEAYQSYIPLKKLSGLRWMQQGTIRAGVSVPKNTQETVQIVVENPKTKLKLVSAEGKPKYNIEIKAKAYIVSQTKNSFLGLQQLTDETKKTIDQEIVELFRTGKETKTDVLNLEHDLYRHHYRQWKASSPAGELLLKENPINEVKIDLNIVHSSSEKYSVSNHKDPSK
ncbi:Ger(x)C family spore germination protein [Paenibacillus sp. 2TAB26]|uniref:Ger(x)C family spore germination protein n=1 Tax=Paenibacillus sp. 2TAB26 TaxID=3233005 RepID=UPI003F95259F